MNTLTELIPNIQLDARVLEREMTRIWHSAMQEQRHALTRTRTINLVICAPNPEAAEQLSLVARQQSFRHPSRTILISNVPHSSEARLDLWMRADANTSSSGRQQVIFEQISIAACGSAAGQVTSVVLTLLVPDLPVVLWWPGRAPFQSALFARLEGLIDRVLVDTASFEAPERDLASLVQLQGRSYTISDLNWARLTPWRDLTAQFFDARALLPHLRRLDRVMIGYEAEPGQPHNRIQALLLAGWLASQLGWTPLDGGVSIEHEIIRLHLRRPAVGVGKGAIRLVTIELQPAPVVVDALDSLASLTLQASDGVLASFIVERVDGDPDCAHTAVDVVGLPAMSRIARLERPDEAYLIGEELRLLAYDRTYHAALQMAGRFAQGLE